MEFNSPRMEEMEMAKNVTIPLRNHVGRHVKVVLFFSSKWILISEVYFSSGSLDSFPDLVMMMMMTTTTTVTVTILT